MVKKIVVLMSLLSLTLIKVHAGELIKTPVENYLSTELDFVYEVKTSHFEKVTLDCQSFITGMNFYKNGEIVTGIYLDIFQCEEMHNFLWESQQSGEPVCLGLDPDENYLMISRETESCQ